MIRIRQFLLVLLFSCSAAAHAAKSFPDAKGARTFVDTVMVKVAAGDFDGAIADIKPFAVVPEAEIDASIGQFKLQLPAIAQRFGAKIGVEFVREDHVGESLMRVIYLQRFEKHAIRWNFYFYRGSTGWYLNTFRFDDNILTLFP